MNLFQSFSKEAIRVSRNLFAGTPIHNWRLTNFLYKKIFNIAYGQRDTRTNFRGLDFIIPTNDISLAPSILMGTFETKELEIFESVCKKGDTVIDVGANIGVYSAIAARKVGPNGKVYAFEPIPENIDFLKQNLMLNNVSSSVEVIAKAVGAKNGKLKIYMLENQIGTHSAVHVQNNLKSINATVVTLDTFVKINKIKKVDVLKIDVEGYDGHVLMGAISTLRMFKPTLFVEYAPQLLEKSGFILEDFQKIIFDLYRYCYLVDEFKGQVYAVGKDNIGSVKIATNVNLVFSDKPMRIKELTEIKPTTFRGGT